MEMMITNLRKENETLRENINKINENFQDIMTLYEVVSNQINPFIGASKITTASIEKIEKLEYETTNLKKKLDELQRDIIILADIYLKQQDMDIDSIIGSIIDDVLAEDETSKVILGEDSNG